MKLKLIHILGVLALTACDRDSPTALPPLLPVSFSTYESYAGGPVTIRSARFAKLRNIEIWADTLQLPVLAAAGDSVVVTLPRQVRGRINLRLGQGGPILGEVEVAGFIGRKSLSRAVSWELMVWPIGAQASVLAGTEEGDVVRIQPASGSITTLLSGYELGFHDARKPGRTPDPSVLLFQPVGGGGQQAWRLLPTPERLYTLPWENWRRFGQLSDSIFLNIFHHRMEMYRRSNNTTQTVYLDGYEDAQDVFISPTRTIATIDLNGSPHGIPVFNALSGETLYHIPFWWSLGTTFSQAGDSLWMAVGSASGERIVLIDPANGTVRDSVMLPDYYLTSMMRDPAGGRLFVFGIDRVPDGRSEINLFVLDDRNFRLLGHIQSPMAVQCQRCVLAVGLDGVFLVSSTEIYEFDYLISSAS